MHTILRPAPWHLFACLALACAGCATEKPAVGQKPEFRSQKSEIDHPAPNHALAVRHDASAAGSIQGTVFWQGTRPFAPVFKILGRSVEWPNDPNERPNPNLPRLGENGEVRDAVVFLRHLDVASSRRWTHPPVRVAHMGGDLVIEQGETRSLIGFVRAGDAIEVVNRDPARHILRGRGADVFALALPDPTVPIRRVLKQPGLVELTSASGAFWMAGYLFVCEHPYFARSDAEGRFHLSHVPPGDYELVCWLPDWHISDIARQPETALIHEVRYHPPAIQRRAIRVQTGRTSEAAFHWSQSYFER